MAHGGRGPATAAVSWPACLCSSLSTSHVGTRPRPERSCERPGLTPHSRACRTGWGSRGSGSSLRSKAPFPWLFSDHPRSHPALPARGHSTQSSCALAPTALPVSGNETQGSQVHIPLPRRGDRGDNSSPTCKEVLLAVTGTSLPLRCSPITQPSLSLSGTAKGRLWRRRPV